MNYFKSSARIAIFVALLLVSFPTGQAGAASDLEKIWEEQAGVQKIGPYHFMNFELSDLGSIAIFLAHFIFAFGAMYAAITVANGGLSLFLAGNSEDDKAKAVSTLISGIGSFVMFVILFFSLDLIVPLVKEWSSRMALS